MKKLKYPAIGFLIVFGFSLNNVVSADDVEQLVLGDHLLTLQWLNYKKPGKAKIFKKDGKIILEGRQEVNNEGHRDYLDINGTIKILNQRELEFDGKIVTKISHINDGIPHERNGKFLLKAWGQRKYWRMQNMTQPDKEFPITDYIDIYFEKYR